MKAAHRTCLHQTLADTWMQSSTPMDKTKANNNSRSVPRYCHCCYDYCDYYDYYDYCDYDYDYDYDYYYCYCYCCYYYYSYSYSYSCY